MLGRLLSSVFIGSFGSPPSAWKRRHRRPSAGPLGRLGLVDRRAALGGLALGAVALHRVVLVAVLLARRPSGPWCLPCSRPAHRRLARLVASLRLAAALGSPPGLRRTHLVGQLVGLLGDLVLVLGQLLRVAAAGVGPRLVDVRAADQAVQVGEQLLENLLLVPDASQFIVALQDGEDLAEDLDQLVVLVLGAVDIRDGQVVALGQRAEEGGELVVDAFLVGQVDRACEGPWPCPCPRCGRSSRASGPEPSRLVVKALYCFSSACWRAISSLRLQRPRRGGVAGFGVAAGWAWMLSDGDHQGRHDSQGRPVATDHGTNLLERGFGETPAFLLGGRAALACRPRLKRRAYTPLST